jgi:hypothetical protein
MSKTTQLRFHDALADASNPVPEGLTSWNLDRPPRRFRVYRDNVRIGLVRALASRFPAAERIVGGEFFAAMAEDFVRDQPPRSPLLLAYGDAFPAFVATYALAESVPYLADVMRIEVARGHAYHAEDRVPLDPNALAAIEPEKLALLHLALHPSVTVLRSRFPAVTIWAMNAGEVPLAPITDWAGQDCLVARPRMTVKVIRLPAGGADFLEALAAGHALDEAASMALAAADDFDLAANLAGALGAGVFLPLPTRSGD